MKFEITETAFNQATDMATVYRYDCYIDDTFITFGTWREKQEPYTVYQHFIKIVLREWKTKYKNKYGMNKTPEPGGSAACPGRSPAVHP